MTDALCLLLLAAALASSALGLKDASTRLVLPLRAELAAGGGEEMEFLVRVGVNGERFEWGPMAINAPVQTIGGGAWEGDIGEVRLFDYAS